LGQSEGRGTGRESVRVDEQAIEGSGPKRRPVGRQGCKGETTTCWSKEGEPWNGCDLTAVFQEAVSFFKPEQKGFQDLLKISPSSLFMLCGCISHYYCIERLHICQKINKVSLQ